MTQIQGCLQVVSRTLRLCLLQDMVKLYIPQFILLLGIKRHGKHNENNAFVKIVCS